MLGRRRPRRGEPVVTSELVIGGRAPVLRVSRSHESSWMYGSGFEDDVAEPLLVPFAHVANAHISLWTLKLRRGEYALRGRFSDEWYVFGPVSDDEYDRLLADGTVDRQHAALDQKPGRPATPVLQGVATAGQLAGWRVHVHRHPVQGWYINYVPPGSETPVYNSWAEDWSDLMEYVDKDGYDVQWDDAPSPWQAGDGP